MVWVQTSGIGSKPYLLEKGWQRSNRFALSHAPRATPNRSIAWHAYTEHVGVNRQFPANNKDK
jgi:hypothetical protein